MVEQPGEVPRPERVNPPFERLFNVDAMSDDQVLTLFQGIYAGHHGESSQHSDTYGELEDVSDPLFYQLALSVRDLATRDPERVKNLLHRCEQSSDEIEHDVVGYTAQALIDYNYEFTRDVLISVYVGDAQRRGLSAGSEGPSRNTIRILMRDRLTPEQAADFNARIAAHTDELWAPLEPAAPGELDYF